MCTEEVDLIEVEITHARWKQLKQKRIWFGFGLPLEIANILMREDAYTPHLLVLLVGLMLQNPVKFKMIQFALIRFALISNSAPLWLQCFLCVLTARRLADDSVCAVSAGARLPQAAVALDPEAGVWRENREGDVTGLPVGVGHLRVLAPHETSTCSTDAYTHKHTQRSSKHTHRELKES